MYLAGTRFLFEVPVPSWSPQAHLLPLSPPLLTHNRLSSLYPKQVEAQVEAEKI